VLRPGYRVLFAAAVASLEPKYRDLLGLRTARLGPIPLPVRLARRLCALASDFGSEVHISQEQLGVFVGAARESVNRQLQLWRKDGILDLQRGRIMLQNMTKLTAVARNE